MFPPGPPFPGFAAPGPKAGRECPTPYKDHAGGKPAEGDRTASFPFFTPPAEAAGLVAAVENRMEDRAGGLPARNSPDAPNQQPQDAVTG